MRIACMVIEGVDAARDLEQLGSVLIKRALDAIELIFH